MREARELIDGPPLEDMLVKVLLERGVTLTSSGDLEIATEHFDAAVALRPEWPFPWYQRAWAHFLAGDSAAALDDYRACAERRSVFFTVQREIRCLEDVAAGRLPLDAYRAYCALRDLVRQSPDQVVEATSRLAERHPDFAPPYLLRAEALLAADDPRGARAATREALTHDPDPDTAAGALFLEWNLARRAGDEEAAREAAERLETAYEDHPAAEIVRRVLASPERDHALRWTFALDGTLVFEEVNPSDLTSPPPARKPPPPGSPG